MNVGCLVLVNNLFCVLLAPVGRTFAAPPPIPPSGLCFSVDLYRSQQETVIGNTL